MGDRPGRASVSGFQRHEADHPRRRRSGDPGCQRGKFAGGNYFGGAGLAPFHDFDDKVPQEVKDMLTKTAAGLIDGSIKTGYGE